MGYTIAIGNASVVHYRDGETLIARWEVERTSHDSAPDFPNDPNGKTNLRMPSYGVWEEFCRDTGIWRCFYDDDGNVRSGYPGTRVLTQADLALVRQARTTREKQYSKPTGFNKDQPRSNVVVQLRPRTEIYDADLARLMWLEYWIGWAIHHCDTPAIEMN